MHSRIFYIDSYIKTKEAFEAAKEDAPPDFEVAEQFKHCDWISVQHLNEYEEDIKWLQNTYNFFKIKKDDIGYYFITHEKEAIKFQKKILEEINTKLSLYKEIKSKNDIYMIKDIIDPKFGMQIMSAEDSIESIEMFLLSDLKKSLRYYIVEIYDYHF